MQISLMYQAQHHPKVVGCAACCCPSDDQCCLGGRMLCAPLAPPACRRINYKVAMMTIKFNFVVAALSTRVSDDREGLWTYPSLWPHGLSTKTKTIAVEVNTLLPLLCETVSPLNFVTVKLVEDNLLADRKCGWLAGPRVQVGCATANIYLAVP